MDERHRRFDADKLFRLKSEHSGYKFCPRCRTELEEQRLDGVLRLACPSGDCDFIFYQNPAPAAGAVVVTDDRILLVKRAHPPKIGWWCIPAGFMEWQEHPSQTAVREVKEETGLDIRLKGFFEVYSGSDDPRTNAVLILYLGEAIGGELGAADDAEEVRYFGFDELPDNIAFASHRQALKDYQERFRKGRS
ncbi:NUDIX domain-containing protein [candidate division GN15 bacterium]|nr:NUDIX domain-containing protein [candidate division GN15 bacterium]